MALKELILMALVGISLSASYCDPANHDCSCSDRSYKECEEPSTVANAVHADTRALCIENCNLFNSINSCDWLIYKGTTTDTNCIMMTNSGEAMDEYTGSCNIEYYPLMREDDTCMFEEGTPACTFCGRDHGDCKGCESSDPKACVNIYHQTECTILAKPEQETKPPENTLDACFSGCFLASSTTATISYVGYNYMDNACTCYKSGERRCNWEIIKALATEAEVIACSEGSGEPSDPECKTDSDCTDPGRPLCDPDLEVCMSGCRAHDDCDTDTEYCDCGEAANDNLGCDDGTKPGKCQDGCRNEGDVCADANGVGGNCQDHQCIATGTPSIESLSISTATCSGCTARGGRGAVLTFQNKITNDVVRPCSTQILDSSNFQSNGEVEFEDDPLGGCLSEPTNSVAEVTVDWVGTGSWVPNTIMVVTKPVGFSYCCLNSGDAASETNPLTISCDDC